MQIFDEPLDPSETKDFAFDWSLQLGEGEVIASQVVTFITAAGTTSPSDSASDTVSTVWLKDGNDGERATFTVRITTSGGRKLEVALGVNIVDSLSEPVAETDIERLTREIAECKAQRINVASGNAVVDVWREGRRVRKNVASLKDLNDLIRILEGELVLAKGDAGVVATPRRTAIGTYY